MWSNFHTHSNWCDGKETIGNVAARAAGLGMLSLGFSSHAPLPFECGWCMKPENFSAYISEVDTLRKKHTELEIYKSLEIDFIPGVISPADYADKLDYTIGSVHFTDAWPDGKHWEIDGPHTPFLNGLQAIFNNDIQRAVSRHYEMVREMISTSSPTIVGHFDKIKIQNIAEKFFRESDPWYVQEIKKIIETLSQHGGIVEVNTRGIYQKKSATTYPSPWILELMQQKNIPITISSDAHHPDDLINQFPETATLLKRIGFKKIYVLFEGAWKAVDFDHNGIRPYA